MKTTDNAGGLQTPYQRHISAAPIQQRDETLNVQMNTLLTRPTTINFTAEYETLLEPNTQHC